MIGVSVGFIFDIVEKSLVTCKFCIKCSSILGDDDIAGPPSNSALDYLLYAFEFLSFQDRSQQDMDRYAVKDLVCDLKYIECHA